MWFPVDADFSPYSSGPVQVAHSVQVSECRSPPSAQDLPSRHICSVGGRGVNVWW